MSTDKPIPERPQPKFKVGQVVVMNSIKKQLPFRVLSVNWFDDGWFYGWNTKNASSEHSLRALTLEETGGTAESLVRELAQVVESTRNAIPKLRISDKQSLVIYLSAALARIPKELLP